MQSKSSCSIIGGTYRELCDACLSWDHVYGSGLRALRIFQAFNHIENISFYSCCSKYLNVIPCNYGNEKTDFHLTKGLDVEFKYEHPFRMSSIKPRPDVIAQHKQKIGVEDGNVLVFGMIDADFKVNADRAVYDPQTCVMPPKFSATSTARELVYVLNTSEAQNLSGCNKLEDIQKFFFEEEKCYALIIKNGSNGATLYRNTHDKGFIIPVFKTNNVFTIGSGDVFTSSFAEHWFLTNNLEESALMASKVTACYSQNRGNIIDAIANLEHFDFIQLTNHNKGQIYLAGPFFTFSQKWLINEFYESLQNCQANVFYPLKDVGTGEPNEVVSPDLKGLNDSDVLLAILDLNDVGTIFEIGYAIAKDKKVVVYAPNSKTRDLTMMIGSHCEIEEDFTTAIYKACWYAEE